MPATKPESIFQLLRNCTVRIDLDQRPTGSGFYVAPGLVLTCAHVISSALGKSAVTIEIVAPGGQRLKASIEKSSNSDYPDLALLRIPLTTSPAVVFQDDDAEPFDRLYTFGYPDQYPLGDPATPECEGVTGDPQPLLRLKGAQIRPGMSGAPILNYRTQRVCGIMQYTRGRDNDMGGRALPVSQILAAFPELSELQRLNQQEQSRWSSSTKAVSIYYVFAEEDLALQKKLRTHLALLRRQNLIADWDQQQILPGEDPEETINEHLNSADIILLLISADFIASSYCYSDSMERAMQRKREGNARVVPILLRPCDWESAPFGKLQPVPRSRKPIDLWPNKDEAFQQVAAELRALIKKQVRGTTIDDR